MQYIALIHKNSTSVIAPESWDRFIKTAIESGMFQGGSEIGSRQTIGDLAVPDTTTSVGGFMRFDSDDLAPLKTLLASHPVVQHGGTIELCEMPRS